MMSRTFYQVAVLGGNPSGGLFETHEAAQREIGFLKADDRRYAEEALSEAGHIITPTQYEVKEVVR